MKAAPRDFDLTSAEQVTNKTLHTVTPNAVSATDELALFARIKMISARELAHALGFKGVTTAFRHFCSISEIRPLPGRRDCYDPSVVRHRLDCIQGLSVGQTENHDALIVSRMRRNA
jgi:hypothetical protein